MKTSSCKSFFWWYLWILLQSLPTFNTLFFGTSLISLCCKKCCFSLLFVIHGWWFSNHRNWMNYLITMEEVLCQKILFYLFLCSSTYIRSSFLKWTPLGLVSLSFSTGILAQINYLLFLGGIICFYMQCFHWWCLFI